MKQRDACWEDSREITHLELLQELAHTFELNSDKHNKHVSRSPMCMYTSPRCL